VKTQQRNTSFVAEMGSLSGLESAEVLLLNFPTNIMSFLLLVNDPLHQPYFGERIFEIGLENYLPWLGSNYDPPDLCLLSS
jgi:hypothetical protein